MLPINQLNEKEHLDHMKHTLKNIFDAWIGLKEKAIKNNFRIEFCDTHDAKFSCTMLQCSPWSRKRHPFYGCKRKRGEAFKKGYCRNVSNEEFESLRTKSENRWRMREVLARSRRRKVCAIEDHRDWIDEMNHGVSYFGVPPED